MAMHLKTVVSLQVHSRDVEVPLVRSRMIGTRAIPGSPQRKVDAVFVVVDFTDNI